MAAATPRDGVPFLPGYSTGSDMFKMDRTRKQTLAFGPGGAMDQLGGTAPPKMDFSTLKTMLHHDNRYDRTKTPLTHDERRAQQDSTRNTFRPALAPAWLKHDRQVLRYYAYFQEPVHESPNENFRVRQCVILFYLEDATMQILEPKVENSGIPQGALVKRHRLPKPEGGYYSIEDLKCGAEMMVYAKRFKITSVDEFTEWFYQNRAFMDVGPKQEPPVDAFQAIQKVNAGQPIAAGGSLSTSAQPSARGGVPREVAEGKEFTELSLGGNRRNVKLQQFLGNDRKVLRFNAFWDDKTHYGARQYYTIHYFLADDTVEILECLARNTGRDPYPIFCKRAPLKKNPVVSATPAMLEPEPIMYKPEDFMVGEYIEVFGREIFLYDCDDFTRDFFQKYIGLQQKHFVIESPAAQHVQLTHPPHTGIGSEEDSLASCLNLIQKPPRKDMKRLMGFSDKVMRFEAVMANDLPEDKNRRFIIAIYMADDTIGVWETKQRNSGHSEGKFAERSKKRSASGEWLTIKDFKVGNVVSINSTTFRLLQADEATENLMQQYAEMFQGAA